MTSTWPLRHRGEGVEGGSYSGAWRCAKVVGMQRPHICREHFVTISICCFKTCLGLFCAGSFGVSCSCSCSCLCCHCCCLGGVGGIGFTTIQSYLALFLIFFFESAFGSLLANICQQQMPKLELVYCGFKILFRANWQPYMVSFDWRLRSEWLKCKCCQSSEEIAETWSN